MIIYDYYAYSLYKCKHFLYIKFASHLKETLPPGSGVDFIHQHNYLIGICLSKVKNRNSSATCEFCSELTVIKLDVLNSEGSKDFSGTPFSAGILGREGLDKAKRCNHDL